MERTLKRKNLSLKPKLKLFPEGGNVMCAVATKDIQKQIKEEVCGHKNSIKTR